MNYLFGLILILLSYNAFALPKFERFKSVKSADKYFNEEFAPVLAGIEGTEKYTILDRGSKNYPRIEKIISDVHFAFREIYFDKIQYSEPPIIIITNSEEVNAFVPGALGKEKTPYFFIAHNGLFQLSDMEIKSIVAHELVHMHLQWESQGERFPKKKYYKKKETMSFGKDILNDKLLEQALKLRAKYRDYAGPFSESALLGVPLHYDPNKISGSRDLKYLLQNAPPSPVCENAKKVNEAYINEILGQHFSYESFEFKIPTLARNQLVLGYSGTFENMLKDCLNGVKYSYTDLIHEVYEVPYETLERLTNNMNSTEKANFQEVSTYYENNNAIDALLLLTKDYRAKVRAIDSEIDLDNVRIYTHEDHADEEAIRVLNYLGISSQDLNNVYIKLFSTQTSKECLFKSDIEPEYGPLENDHHFSCWRAYRNYKLEKTL